MIRGRNSCNLDLGDNSGNIATDINGNVIQNQNNIKTPSPLEIENEKHWQDNEAKISSFFRYWNSKEYYKARNIIGEDISLKFTDDNMKFLLKDMTDFFEITKIEKRGQITNSDFFISTKHNIDLFYAYKWEKYTDRVFIVVTRDKDDTTQHHITQIKCESTNGPFCEFLKGKL